MTSVSEGTLLWQPSEELKQNSVLRSYIDWLADRKGLRFDTYDQLWSWSVAQVEDFWVSIWDYFQVQASQPYTQVLSGRSMPGAR